MSAPRPLSADSPPVLSDAAGTTQHPKPLQSAVAVLVSPANAPSSSPSLTISHDALSATLTIPCGVIAETLSLGSLLLLARERGLPDTTALRDGLSHALKLAQGCVNPAQPLDRDLHEVVLRGTPPTPGADASLTLVVPPAEPDLMTATTPSDHRARSSLRVVRRGETIAHITPPTQAHDGIDVHGTCIRAAPAKPLRTKFDASVRVLKDFRVVAMRDGALHATPESLAITSEFTIEGDIDYSTGNVDVPGNLFIAGNVADCFVVKAMGDITVAQLVDAATLHASRDLTLRIGAAGRGIGSLSCGRDLRAPCLSGLEVRVGRHAAIDRELADCKLFVAGEIIAPNCTLVRGEARATGGMTLGTLGSASTNSSLASTNSQTPTGSNAFVVVGHHEVLDALACKLAAMREQLAKQIERASQRTKQLSLLTKLSASEAEEMTDLSFQLMQHKPLIAKLLQGFRTVQERIHASCKSELVITQRIEAGAIVALAGPKGGIIATFTQSVRGPIRIVGPMPATDFDIAGNQPRPAREAQIIDDLAKTSAPLASVARVEPWPAVADHSQLCKAFGLDLSTLLAAAAMRAGTCMDAKQAPYPAKTKRAG